MIEKTTTVESAPATQKKSFVSRWLTPILALVAAVGVGIFGGVLIGQNTATTAAETPAGFTPPEGLDGAPAGGFGNLTSGEITAIDGDVVTLTLDDGTTVTVTASDDTTYTVTGELSDLTVGDTVTASGEADDDGNITATSISEGTGFGGFGGGTPPTDQR